MTRQQVLIICFAIILFLLGLDLITKTLFLNHHGPELNELKLSNGLVALNNTPTVFQMLNIEINKKFSFYLLFFIAIGLSIRSAINFQNGFFPLGDLFFLPGVWGNLLSRFMFNGIVDFIPFYFDHSLLLFNLADLYILIGLLLFLIEESFLSTFFRLNIKNNYSYP
ncbi:MAG: signal peptidase II [Colwellia sp.]